MRLPVSNRVRAWLYSLPIIGRHVSPPENRAFTEIIRETLRVAAQRLSANQQAK